MFPFANYRFLKGQDNSTILPLLSSRSKLPRAVDWREYTGQVFNQASLGCCVSISLATAAAYLLNKDYKTYTFSPTFLYYVTRVLENDESPRSDEGSTLYEGIRALSKYGICKEKYWVFEKRLAFRRPSGKAFRDASRHRLLKWKELRRNLYEIREMLARGYLINIGIQLYESFQGRSVLETGIVPMPNRHRENIAFGHAVVIVGYNDETQLFTIQNSWGESVGDQGFFYLPYAYVLDSHLCSEIVCLIKMS